MAKGNIITIGDGVSQRDTTVITVWKNLSIEDLEGEQWANISGYEGLYQISNFGRIKSTSRGKHRIKSQMTDSNNPYLRVELSKNGENIKHLVHRLVGIHFVPNPDNKPNVNHLRGNKHDNRHFMLEWATPPEDRQHALNILKVNKGRPWAGVPSEKHPMYGRKGTLSPNYGKRGEKSHMYGRTGAKCATSIPVKCLETGEVFENMRIAEEKLKLGKGNLGRYFSGISCDVKGYTFEKISNKVSKISTSRIKIFCQTNGITYTSLTHAAAELNLQPSKISLVLKGKRNHTGGYVFKCL